MAEDVTRSVDLEASPDDVWRAVADPDERARWLDDPDAVSRRVRVDEAAPGERLVWTWWRPGEEGDASTVSVVLSPLDTGGTRVVVTESLPAFAPVQVQAQAQAEAHAQMQARADIRATAVAAWAARLVGLELVFAGGRVPVAVA
jgi:uncharacterized protein YndB with AHSA1/START domain